MTISINALYYAVVFLYAVNIDVTTGLYFYDIAILLSLLYIVKSKKELVVGSNTKMFLLGMVFFILLPAVTSLIYQLVAYPELTQKYSIYVIYNIVVLSMYVIFIENTHKKTSLDFNIISLLLFIPILISLLMYFNENINSLFVDLYNIEGQNGSRSAGIWGRDVNQLGYYATLYVFFNLYMLYSGRVRKILAITLITISFVSIVISGMRLGVYVLTTLLVLFSLLYKTPVVKIRSIALYCVFLVLLGVMYSIFSEDASILNYLFKRFDVGLFISDLTGDGKHRHVADMYVKWFYIFTDHASGLDGLFAFYPKWKFPDSLVIFYFANHGLLGVSFALIFISLIFAMILRLNNQYIPMFIFLFLLIVSFKGNFAFNNMGMFLLTWVLFLSRYDSFHVKQQKTHT